MKNHEDFKVGKKYKTRFLNAVYTCIGHKLSGIPVMDRGEGFQLLTAATPSEWKEHREPREYWILISETGSRICFGSEKDAILAKDRRHVPGSEIILVREVLDEE